MELKVKRILYSFAAGVIAASSIFSAVILIAG
jgi:hypothetical protein